MTISSLSQYNHRAIAIYKLLNLGYSYKATICNELKSANLYNTIKVRYNANVKRRKYRLQLSSNKRLRMIKLTWSPEKVAHKIHCCTKLILTDKK